MAGFGNGSLGRFVLRLAALAGKRSAGVLVAGVALAGFATLPALAQGWWPFGGNQNQNQQRRAPVPSEGVYQDPATQGQQAGQGGWSGNRSPICVQLEQRLVQEGQRGTDSRTLIPMVENELRQVEQAYRGFEQQLNRNDCYEYFLFSKTLRRTRRCVDLANQSDDARQRIDDLELQLRQIQGSSGRSYQDEIIRELARNKCGTNYEQQARRQSGGFAGFWEDEESTDSGGPSFGALPYATYRTVCVRLCDGYFFPVSFSTLPNHFQRDEEVCHSKCAAPAALYYHQNPGAGMEQAVDARSNAPYTQLKSAFRYRKEYVNGCSCKMAEYQPEPGVTVNQGAAGGAEGWAAQGPTGSTDPQQQLPPPPAEEQQGGDALPWSVTP